ncbi:hypothetical protein ACPB9E_10935 [Streptomyces exfoliatus]|uniref:hypothetical protein n=1 Tax=Streptomyces exfoliatus TaxID=1905 RepID=UPI003C2BDAAA
MPRLDRSDSLWTQLVSRSFAGREAALEHLNHKVDILREAKKKRGLYAAAPQMGSPVGYFAATITFLAASPSILGGVLGGAAAPLIVTALGDSYRPSVGGWFTSAMALLSLVCVIALPETKERDLDRV